MKTTRVTFLLGGLGACLAASAIAQIDYRSTPRARLVPTITSNDFKVTGEVISRRDTEFTVLDRWSQLTTIQVNEDTEIKKTGALIRVTDLIIGEKVDVTVMRGGDGRLQAVRVTVKSAGERI